MLVDVLRIVPGFDILTYRTGEREFGVRDVSDLHTSKIKLLIDGHTMDWPFGSTFTTHFSDLVVENAKKIEIIRVPGFVEMFTKNNPSRLGNSDLDPEKINTFEFNMGYNFTKDIRTNITYFYNRIRDNIVLGPKTLVEPQLFINSGGSRIHGIEAEIWADFGGDNYAYANYTYQDGEDT